MKSFSMKKNPELKSFKSLLIHSFILLLSFFAFTLQTYSVFAQKGSTNDSLSSIKAQNRKVKTMEKDTLSDQNKSNIPSYIVPEILPTQFSNFSRPKDGSILSLGISNPGNARKGSMKIAKHRADLLFTMLKDVQIENVTEIYNKRTSGTYVQEKKHFRELTKFSSSFQGKVTKTVIDSFFTKYGEAVVLVKYLSETSDSSKTISVKGNSFAVYESSVRSSLHHFTLEYYAGKTTDSLEDSSYYHFRNYKNRYSLVSRYNKDTLPSRYDYYYYQTNIQPGSAKETVLRTRYGLWNAFVGSFIRKAIFNAKQKAVKVKNLEELYSEKVNEELSRIIVREKLSMKLKALYLHNNELSVVFQRNNKFPEVVLPNAPGI